MITNEMSILIKSIFYIISSILLPLLVAEVALRVYDYFSPSHFFFHTQKARHKRYRPPGHSMHYNFRLNSDGFNDEEFSESKSPNTHRIVCIGDSFVYGIKTWSIRGKCKYLLSLQSYTVTIVCWIWNYFKIVRHFPLTRRIFAKGLFELHYGCIVK